MTRAVLPPPHADRVAHRLVGMEPGVIQLWGWPGSGKRAILSALEREVGGDLARLPAEMVEDLAEAAAPALPTAPWLVMVASAGGDPKLEQLARRLVPGQRLVVASSRLLDAAPSEMAVLGPQELLLSEEETAAFLGAARGDTGADADADADGGALSSRDLWRATDGWYEPLRQARSRLDFFEPASTREGAISCARARGEMAEALLELPSWSGWIERNLAATFSTEELAALLELSALEAALGDGWSPELWREVWSTQGARLAAFEGLLARRGLFVPEGPRRRLPAPLSAWCRRQRAARVPGAMAHAASHRLALAAYGRGRAEVALAALVSTGDWRRAVVLAEAEWLRLWCRAPCEQVREVVERSVASVEPAFTLLRWTLEAVEGDRESARAGLEGLAARERSRPRIAAASALALAALGPEEGRAGAASLARHTLLQGADADSPPLLALIESVEGARQPASGPLGSRSIVDRLSTLARQTGRLTEPITPPSARADSAGGTTNRCDVTLFGVPRVLAGHAEGAGPLVRSEVRWSLRRAFQIFAFLASAPGRRASREAIIEAAWPSERESVVDKNFHPTLSHLRRALRSGSKSPPPLQYVNGVYQLNPEIDWRIDTARFRRLVEEGRLHAEAGRHEAATVAWERAWRQYRGPFLEGFYEPWAEERREQLSVAYLDTLRRLAELMVVLDNPERSIDAFRAVLVVDPLQEGIHLAIMRIYAMQGRRDLVRRQYDRLGRLLRDELLVEPMEETTAEYHRLMG